MERLYKYKDLPMLTACLVVSGNFVENKAALAAEDTSWADPFITDYVARTEASLQNNFGIASNAALKEATNLVNNLQENMKDNLGMVRTQIETKFRANKQ